MKNRVWKFAALAMGGGILLQATGCSTALTQQVVQLVLSQVMNIVLQSILAGAPVA